MAAAWPVWGRYDDDICIGITFPSVCGRLMSLAFIEGNGGWGQGMTNLPVDDGSNFMAVWHMGWFALFVW